MGASNDSTWLEMEQEDSCCGAVWFNTVLVCMLILCGCGKGLAIKTSESGSSSTPYDMFSVSVAAEGLKLGFAFVQMTIARWNVERAREEGDLHACLPGEDPQDAADGQPRLSGLKENTLFLVPGLLFAVSNNLVFLILTLIDPGTMSMIWNLKIVLTAILLRAIGRVISGIQLAGVLLLTLGVLISQHSKAEEAAAGKQGESGYLRGSLLALVSMCVVCVANVSCEWIYKRTHANQYRQYCRLYAAGVVINFACLLIHDGQEILAGNLFAGYSWWTWLVIGLTGCHGFVVGMTFKHLDNIVLVFCDVAMMVIVSVVSWWLWDFKLDLNFAAGILIIAAATYLYYVKGAQVSEPKSPALRYAPITTAEDGSEGFAFARPGSELENERI